MNIKKVDGLMAIVIKEIVVKTTVEASARREPETIVKSELFEQLKEEIVKELKRREYKEGWKKER